MLRRREAQACESGKECDDGEERIPQVSRSARERNFGREIEKELATSALKQPTAVDPVEVFRDLGMSGSAIADYLRRFPDLHRS